MPSCYAHARFGQQIRPLLPGKAAKAAARFPQLFTVGLQGPDPFFYYNPLMKTKAGSLGNICHRQSGKTFFSDACGILRGSPNEGAEAYLYGVLGHYTLDILCHPFVKTATADGRVRHVELEAEFDRYLMEKDGLLPAWREDLSRFLCLTREEVRAMAMLYPSVSPAAVGAAVRNMAAAERMMASKHRVLVRKLFQIAGQSDMLVPEKPNVNCQELNRPMLERFDRAVGRYGELAEQLTAHLYEKKPLGEYFRLNFSGE